jgi:predicted CXXCH cytochrome family protein
MSPVSQWFECILVEMPDGEEEAPMAGTRGTGPLAIMLYCIALMAILGGSAGATEALLSDEAKACLECHARRGLRVTFQNNESIEAYVDVAQFKASVHRSLTCSQCHTDFSGAQHPHRTFRSKAHYQTRASLTCRRCHKDEQIRTRSIHAALLSEEQQGRPTVCTNCHGSHAVMRVTGERRFSSEEEYCMKCHSHHVKMTFKNGETRSVVVDAASLQASVHSKLACSDCHYGFSSEEHPQRNFRSRRDYTLASSESCRRCHFDKYTKTFESIHYAMLSQGNLNAPVCVDCHGSHAISHIVKDRAVTGKRCQKCHQDIYNIYAQSIHGNALVNENNKDVPVCVDCHTAHTIQDPFTSDYRERIPGICSSCHADKAIVGKYGLSTDVIRTYLSDFHGVTLEFYKMQKEMQKNGQYKPAKPMAVCTDCHGTHNITSITGPDATVLKANLVKTCRRCHEDATENFPDTWLSHYEPSWATAPLVFTVGLLYQILLPIMVAGLTLQVLLHLWRYVVDR